MTPRSILVIDDNRGIQRSLPALLEEEGYTVSVAINGEDGFRAMCSARFDLVITDLAMPDVDGIEFIRLMQRDPFFARIPIVAMTAHGGRRLQEAKDAGASVVFEKPLDHGMLLNEISRLTSADVVR